MAHVSHPIVPDVVIVPPVTGDVVAMLVTPEPLPPPKLAVTAGLGFSVAVADPDE